MPRSADTESLPHDPSSDLVADLWQLPAQGGILRVDTHPLETWKGRSQFPRTGAVPERWRRMHWRCWLHSRLSVREELAALGDGMVGARIVARDKPGCRFFFLAPRGKQQPESESAMRSSVLVRLAAVIALAFLGGLLTGSPAAAEATPDAAAAPGGPAVTKPRGDVAVTGLRIRIAGLALGVQASVTVSGPHQRRRADLRVSNRYSTVIHRSTTLVVSPGSYRVTSAKLAAVGGSYVPDPATKVLQVRRGHVTGFTVSYRFVPSRQQKISFTQPASTALSAATIGMVATATSGLVVTFTSATPSICRTSGGSATVTLVALGTCRINADQAGNATFARAARVTRSFAVTAGVCGVVGGTGPGGGKIFFVDLSRPTGSQCFEAAPDGWDDAGSDPNAEWGCSGVDIAGATGLGIGAGEANTVAVVNGCDTAGIAARLAFDYGNGGQTDWFLPSKDELNQLCKFARGQSTTVASQTVACNNSGTLQPGFAGDDYWSSSQSVPSRAWEQTFGSVDRDDESKDGLRRVRPIRAY